MKRKTLTLEETYALRAIVGKRFLKEKENCESVSNKTVEYSQLLDIPIVEQQRKLFEEYKKSKMNNDLDIKYATT